MSAEDRNGEVSTDEKCTDCTTQERSFDELTRGLASATVSRRGALRLLAGALFGGVLASVPGVGRTAQAVTAPGGSTCANQGESCTAQHCCEGLDCLTDSTNSTEKFCCSPLSQLVCGRSCCPTGALGNCSAGNCVCPTGEVVCPDANNPLAGKCVNLLGDPDNCGGCGVVCPGPSGPDAPCRVRACVNGTCTTIANTTADGVLCEDGDLCTVGDQCQNGTCQSGPVTVCNQCFKCEPTTGLCEVDPDQVGQRCNDNDPCTVNDVCTPTGTCVGTPKDCNDNNACTADSCDPTTGNCVHTPLTGTACNDNNPCTLGDICRDGRCVGEAVNCSQCLRCNQSTGICEADPNQVGQRCNDNDPCTENDQCTATGTCVGTPKTCPTGQVCVSGNCQCPTGTCGSNCTGITCGQNCCSGIDNQRVCCPPGTRRAGQCRPTIGACNM